MVQVIGAQAGLASAAASLEAAEWKAALAETESFLTAAVSVFDALTNPLGAAGLLSGPADPNQPEAPQTLVAALKELISDVKEFADKVTDAWKTQALATIAAAAKYLKNLEENELQYAADVKTAAMARGTQSAASQMKWHSTVSGLSSTLQEKTSSASAVF